MKALAWLLLGFVALATGCGTLTTAGRVDLGKHRRVWVEQRLNDNLGVGRKLAGELQALGYTADVGPLTMMPENTEWIVTYDAREEWDFRAYLIELNVSVRPTRDYNLIVSTARYFHPGVTKKSSDAMIHELVVKLFPPCHAK
ncbi:hypothetical protein [Oleiharenicola sp. Vm1]|uniref:hypothetical protein n=1 Tax=Oleiharenicola sp. Vm1 TaxID=3398393 RepID=UPI0039F4AF01